MKYALTIDEVLTHHSLNKMADTLQTKYMSIIKHRFMDKLAFIVAHSYLLLPCYPMRDIFVVLTGTIDMYFNWR